jgi:ATPase subunit of ABC transporter with duplicated ATPase domains
MNSIVTVSGVAFELPNGRFLLQNLYFSLETQITALVGPNGVGKTCLAQLLSGELEPTEGTIRRSGSLTFFHQRESPPAVSVAEYLALEYVWSQLGDELLGGIQQESLCSQLSGGQWMRVRLARHLNDQFLILDEPTNDLDREARQALLRFLQERCGGTLLISHDRECLQLCQEVLELSNRGLTKFGGSWNDYEEFRSQERQHLQANLIHAKKHRDHVHAQRQERKAQQEKRNRRGAEAAARGGMPKILLGARKRQAQTTTGGIDSSTLEKAQSAASDAFEAYQDLKIDPVMFANFQGQEIPTQKLVAEANQFNIRFAGWIYAHDLNFHWRGPLRLALKGPNGSGKSTLLKALMGQPLESRGFLRKGDLETLYIDQQCSVLDDSKSIFENIREVSSATESEIRNGLAQFLFTKDSVFQKVESLSGGERLRAALARGFLSLRRPELLFLDEPTNNLDLVNIEFLENLLKEFRGALIVISHDDIFLRKSQIFQELILSATD